MALRQTFASSSRLTLHHLPSPSSSHSLLFAQPSLLTQHLRLSSSLAQRSELPSLSTPVSGFDPAYSGPVRTASPPLAAAATSTSPSGGGANKQVDQHATPAVPAAQVQDTGKGERRKVELKSKKNAIIMTPAALDHLRSLIASPTTPRLLRISVKSRGCAGMAYHLDYVPPPGGRFDEVVEQDGVKVLIDSKALFSIIGSRMDWRDNRLSAGFVFDNPNVVDTCGCGESFNIRI